MTNDELDKAIAEHLGWDWWAVEKGGWWYRQNGCGYTANLLEAGKYTKDAAEKQLVRGEPMSIRRIPHPSYSTDLNAMHEAVASLNELELSRYADEVCDLAYNGHHDADIQKILKMGARELAECYVIAIGKWEGK